MKQILHNASQHIENGKGRLVVKQRNDLPEAEENFYPQDAFVYDEDQKV